MKGKDKGDGRPRKKTSSRSSSRNPSRSRSRSRGRDKKRRERSRSRDSSQKNRQKNKALPKRPPVRISVNANILSSIITDQKRTNNRMDKEQVQKANQKLKISFPGENLQATLMTEYLSKGDKPQQPILEQIFRPLVCSYKESCKMRFRYAEQLKLHEQEHRIQDEQLTRKAKNLLNSILNKH